MPSVQQPSAIEIARNSCHKYADVALLGPLVSATQKQDHCCAVLREIVSLSVLPK